jgi:hypothetical protein
MKNREMALDLESVFLMLNPKNKKQTVQSYLKENDMLLDEGGGKLKRGFNLHLEFNDSLHTPFLKPYGFGFLGKNIELYSGLACIYSLAYIDQSLSSKRKSELNLSAFNTAHNAITHYPLDPMEGVELTEQMCRANKDRQPRDNLLI